VSSQAPITVPPVDDELPRVTPGLLRRAGSMCRLRLARELGGGKRHANKGSDAPFAVANRVTGDARLAHAEGGAPRPEAFVEPREMEPEQRALYRAAVRGYLLSFGDVAARTADLGWTTELPDHGVELVYDPGIAVELADGVRELRTIALEGSAPKLDRLDVACALARTAAWAPDRLRIVAVDLLSLERVEHEPDLEHDRPDALGLLDERIEVAKRNAADGRPRAGADCQGCAFVARCSLHKEPA